MPKIPVLSSAEVEILQRSTADPNYFFDYWFRKKGQTKGWQLDANFDERGKWQETMCMASQSFIVAICGIATGKSLGVVMSAAYHATVTKSFKFLNVAKEGWQSKLMHRILLEQAKDTPFEKMIVSSPTRPYPVIVISFYIGEMLYESTLEFMSLGEGGDATNIFSWRGDWINIEEAGRIDNLMEIVGNLATRLTGVTAEGRTFLARFSCISNPWDNIEMWMLYDSAKADTEDGLVFNIDTSSNKNVSEKQVKLALKRIPEENHEKFMTGNRPQGRGGYFSNIAIDGCESELMDNTIVQGYKAHEPGYVIDHNPILGVWHFRTPRKPNHFYFILGDPGTGAAPSRNAPSVIVADVTRGESGMIPIVAMWWGNGGSSIMPFVNKILEWTEFYKPIYVGVDSTGTQKNTAELMNLDHVIGKNYSVPFIDGLNFASAARYGYLIALQLSIESGTFQWPKFLYKSLSSQMKNYDPIKDRNPNSKLPQDLVACMAMLAAKVREKFSRHSGEEEEQTGEGGSGAGRDQRRSSRERDLSRDRRREGGGEKFPA